jgi:hypothetical protein
MEYYATSSRGSITDQFTTFSQLAYYYVQFKVRLRSMRRLLVTSSVVPSSPIIITLMKEALSSSETSVLT